MLAAARVLALPLPPSRRKCSDDDEDPKRTLFSSSLTIAQPTGWFALSRFPARALLFPRSFPRLPCLCFLVAAFILFVSSCFLLLCPPVPCAALHAVTFTFNFTSNSTFT